MPAYAALLKDDGGDWIAVGETASSKAARLADWLGDHGYGTALGAIPYFPGPEQFIVYDDRAKFRETIYQHKTRAERQAEIESAAPIPWDHPVTHVDLVKGRRVVRPAGRARRGFVVSDIPCCTTNRVKVPAQEDIQHQPVCTRCGFSYDLTMHHERDEGFEPGDGGWLGLFTVTGHILVASGRYKKT